MYEVNSDPRKNLIHLKMSGFLNEEEIGKGADEVLAKLATLKPGFVFINDVAEFKHTSQEGVEHIMRVQKAVNDANPGMIIRVGAGALAQSQLNRGGKHVKVGYEVRQVKTFEEAMKVADEFLG